eukprot:4534863-Pleurochrysis_carterae.AAC.1
MDDHDGTARDEDAVTTLLFKSRQSNEERARLKKSAKTSCDLTTELELPQVVFHKEELAPASLKPVGKTRSPERPNTALTETRQTASSQPQKVRQERLQHVMAPAPRGTRTAKGASTHPGQQGVPDGRHGAQERKPRIPRSNSTAASDFDTAAEARLQCVCTALCCAALLGLLLACVAASTILIRTQPFSVPRRPLQFESGRTRPPSLPPKLPSAPPFRKSWPSHSPPPPPSHSPPAPERPLSQTS